jgi:UDP-N-acetylglucosamine 4-epimerase
MKIIWQLFNAIKDALQINGIVVSKNRVYRDFRAGELLQSQTDVAKAKKILQYEPTHVIKQGIPVAIPLYINFMSN